MDYIKEDDILVQQNFHIVNNFIQIYTSTTKGQRG